MSGLIILGLTVLSSIIILTLHEEKIYLLKNTKVLLLMILILF